MPIAFLGCNAVKEPEFVRIDNIKFTKQVEGDLYADATLIMRNEALISYSASDINFEVFYNNKHIADGNCVGPVDFEKNIDQSVNANIIFHTDLLLDDVDDLLNKDSILLKINVSGLFSNLEMKANAKIDKYIKTKELMDATISSYISDSNCKVEKLSLKSISIQNSIIEHQTKLTNPLPIEYTLKSVSFNVYSDVEKRNKVAVWNNDYNKIIKPNASDTIQGNIAINNANSALTGLFKAMSGDNTYYVDGKAKISIHNKELDVPINIQFILDLINQKVIIKP
jgi:hypothetical protein